MQDENVVPIRPADQLRVLVAEVVDARLGQLASALMREHGPDAYLANPDLGALGGFIANLLDE